MDYNVDNIESKAEIKPTMNTDIVLHKDGKFQRAKIFGFNGKIKPAFVDSVINQTINNNTYELDPEQIVPSEALYNDAPETLAGDILKRVDKNTGEDVNYREITEWHDGSIINDSKVDGIIYVKNGNNYYVLVDFLSGNPINVKWFGAKGDNSTNDTQAFIKAHDFIKKSIPPNQLRPPRLFIPRGNYIIDSFSIDVDGFQMFGEGSKQTVFKFSNGMGDAPAGIYLKNSELNTEIPGFEFYKNIKIENIGCDPSTIPNGKSFILLRNVYDFTIRHVDVDTESFALVNKFALTIADNSYTGSIENCYLPKINCIAGIAWTITTITFINVRAMNIRMTKCLGMTFIQAVVQGKENEKFLISDCDTVTIMGGDMEDEGIYLNFAGNNSNIRSFGNNILALGGAYSNGTIPQNSYFDDKGNIGIGATNVDGLFGKQLIKGLANSVIQTLTSISGYAYQVIGNSDGALNKKFTYTGSASNYRTWGKISDDMQVKTEFMRLTDNGNLLIGTDDDIGAKLVVNGMIAQRPGTSTSANSGSAVALPSNPKGYFETNINGETVKVAYYN